MRVPSATPIPQSQTSGFVCSTASGFPIDASTSSRPIHREVHPVVYPWDKYQLRPKEDRFADVGFRSRPRG